MRPGTRAATADDTGDLARMHRAALEEAHGSKGGAALVAEVGRGGPEAARRSFSEDLDSVGVEVLVATLSAADGEPRDGAVLGYGVLELPSGGTPHDAVGDRPGTGRISEIWVEPEARRIGLGTALLEALGDLAAAAGCGYLDSVALPGDRSTKNFFEDHAMVARAIVVQRRLPSTGETGA